MLWALWFAVPALALGVLALVGGRRLQEWWMASLTGRLTGPTPPATIIVPVKGPEEGLAEHLGALAAQDYPDYELIITAWKSSDIPPGVVPPDARVVEASAARLPVLPGTGEKVMNLMAAVKAARASSQVLVFADSDGEATKEWLRALISALHQEGAGAATGFRVYIPSRPGLWSLLRSLWDAVILSNFAPSGYRLAWGGATAIRREDFDLWRVLDYWNGTVSDDYRLAAALRKNSRRIVFAPRALVRNPSSTGCGEFLAWIRRQAVITRVYNPGLWILGAVSHLVYCSAMVICIAGMTLGHRWLLVPLA